MSYEKFQEGCCSEEFAELCALSTCGELSAEESTILNEHVAQCAGCAALLREYTSVVRVGMAKLAVEQAPEIAIPFGYNEAKADHRFASAIHSWQQSRRSKARTHVYFAKTWKGIRRHALLIGTAAVLLVCIGGAFELGRKITPPNPRVETSAVLRPRIPADGENPPLQAKLEAAQSSLTAVAVRSSALEKQLAELSSTKASLEARIAELTQGDDSDEASLAFVTQQRDGLQQRLNETSTALIRAKEDVISAQQDRQEALLRVAGMERQVNDLHAEFAAKDDSATSDVKYPAADRNIRELMGARQLYIADVFDVQNNGERSKPFGRVFYTKGKSLIFYAFDLEKQPGYREAKAFQAWGKPDSASAKAISLGIFYMDNEQNGRWAIKSDNPAILSQINTVFVTVEPRGGSQEPTGKPFLEAYLHSLPPNHP